MGAFSLRRKSTFVIERCCAYPITGELEGILKTAAERIESSVAEVASVTEVGILTVQSEMLDVEENLARFSTLDHRGGILTGQHAIF